MACSFYLTMAPQQNLSARQIAIVVLGKTSWPLIMPVLATVTAAVNDEPSVVERPAVDPRLDLVDRCLIKVGPV